MQSAGDESQHSKSFNTQTLNNASLDTQTPHNVNQDALPHAVLLLIHGHLRDEPTSQVGYNWRQFKLLWYSGCGSLKVRPQSRP